MNKIKFKTQKMSFKANLKLKIRLYIMIIKKYFRNIGNIFKALSGTIAILAVGIFSFTSISNFINSDSININTSNIVMGKQYREQRLLSYHKASQKNRLNQLKMQKYKNISFKRKIINN